MPLSKAKNRERMRELRLHNKQSTGCVQPKIQGLVLKGNRIIGISKPVQPSVQPKVPLYNPAIHKAGDTVMMMLSKTRPRIIKIPEIDAEGNPIPEICMV